MVSFCINFSIFEEPALIQDYDDQNAEDGSWQQCFVSALEDTLGPAANSALPGMGEDILNATNDNFNSDVNEGMMMEPGDFADRVNSMFGVAAAPPPLLDFQDVFNEAVNEDHLFDSVESEPKDDVPKVTKYANDIPITAAGDDLNLNLSAGDHFDLDIEDFFGNVEADGQSPVIHEEASQEPIDVDAADADCAPQDDQINSPDLCPENPAEEEDYSAHKNDEACATPISNPILANSTIVEPATCPPGRKRKLYEVDQPLADPAAEKCRLNAINAKKNREIKKRQLAAARHEMARLRSENEELREEAVCARDELAEARAQLARMRTQLKLAGQPKRPRLAL